MCIDRTLSQLSHRRFVALSVLLLSVGSSACRDSSDTTAVDSTLLRDLTLAAAPAPVTATPMLGDTAAGTAARAPERSMPDAPVARPPMTPPPPAATRSSRPARPSATAPQQPAPRQPEPSAPVAAPTAPTSAPQPAAPATTTTASSTSGATVTPAGAGGAGRRALGAGTALAGKTDAQICTLANRPGDRLVATLSEDVTGPDGARIPAGTPILVEMAAPSTDGTFAFRAKAVQLDGTLIPIDGAVTVSGTPTERRVSKGGDKQKVIGGAVAGAILGRVLGGGARGTVIGAAGGAAAGTIAAARNAVTERCLPAGSTLTVVLSAPLVLTQGAP